MMPLDFSGFHSMNTLYLGHDLLSNDTFRFHGKIWKCKTFGYFPNKFLLNLGPNNAAAAAAAVRNMLYWLLSFIRNELLN